MHCGNMWNELEIQGIENGGFLEESKCHSYIEEEQEKGSRELEAGQPHLSLWEGGGTAWPGNHIQVHEGEENLHE